MSNRVIAKGQIGNALTSTAADHIVAVAEDVFDESLQMYQSQINSLIGSGSLFATLDNDSVGDVSDDGHTPVNPFAGVSDDDWNGVITSQTLVWGNSKWGEATW